MIPVFLYIYFGIAHIGHKISDVAEIFPFFNWSLFTNVSDEKKLLEIEILAIDDEYFTKPVRYYDLKSKFPLAAAKDITHLKLLYRIYAALRTNSLEKFNALKRTLETVYLRGHRKVRYRLTLKTYNPIERWRAGRVRHVEVVGEFVFVDRLK